MKCQYMMRKWNQLKQWRMPFESYNSMFNNNAFPEMEDADAPSDHVYVYVRSKNIIVTDNEYQKCFLITGANSKSSGSENENL